jgi:hypothetical protein
VAKLQAPTIEDLTAWLARADGEYAARQAAAEAQVATREWWTHPGRTVQPLYRQRHGSPVGRRLSKPPRKPTLQNAFYGLDARGRVVVEHEYIYKGRGYYRLFYEWQDGRVDWVRYDDDQRAVAVHRADLDGERVVAASMRGHMGGYATRFTYSGDRLTRIDETHTDAAGKTYQPQVFAITWNALGQLSTITRDQRLVYEAPKKEQTLDALLDAVADELLELIPQRVAAMKLAEPAFSLVVAYPGPGNDNFPPTVGVGTERERKVWVANGAAINGKALWSASQYHHYDTDLPESPLFATANRQVAQADAYKKVSATYARLAAALRQYDWTRHLPVTPDFVVLASDYDETELAPALRQALGKAGYARFKKGHWVP